MKLQRTLPILILASPLLLRAANRDIIEVQRDIALLQQQVSDLQKSVDRDSATLKVLTEQALGGAFALSAKFAVLQNSLTDKLNQEQTVLAAPVAGLSTRTERIASEVQGVNTSIADVGERLGKLQQQVIDLSNAVRTIQSPPPPPPSAAQLPNGVTAEGLYQDAVADKLKGNFDLAVQEFGDYVKYFGSSDMAGNAEFHLGEIYYDRGDPASALNHFNAILDRCQQSDRLTDASYMKALCLLKLGQHGEGLAQLRGVAQRFPNTEVAREAQARLKTLQPAKRTRG
jgi:TolA-binding protein